MEATIISKLGTNSIPSYINVDYQLDSIGSSEKSTELYEIILPGMDQGKLKTQIPAPSNMEGSSYAILLISFSISCNSEKYDVRFFNKYNEDPEEYEDTIYEILHYESINLSMFDILENNIIINKDVPIENKLYLSIDNQDSNETGPILISLTYHSLQNKSMNL